MNKMNVILCCFFTVLAVELSFAHEEQYIWFPDEGGQLHLIDLHQKATGKNVSVENITFELWTKENGDKFQRIIIGDLSTLGTFNPSRPTRFVIHGYLSSGEMISDLRNAYRDNGDYNVIVTDWSAYTDGLYSDAAENAKQVAELIADLMEFIVSNGADPSDIQFVGHSLGGQVCGLTGSRTQLTIKKITALDPARPIFEDADIYNRLDDSDAEFVQVIHTNAGMLGIAEPVGHADFYPNGGERQPGCSLDLGGQCSHRRSREYFVESFTTTVGFVGRLCGNMEEYNNGTCTDNPSALMGEKIDTSTRGVYYLATASGSPFALG